MSLYLHTFVLKMAFLYNPGNPLLCTGFWQDLVNSLFRCVSFGQTLLHSLRSLAETKFILAEKSLHWFSWDGHDNREQLYEKWWNVRWLIDQLTHCRGIFWKFGRYWQLAIMKIVIAFDNFEDGNIWLVKKGKLKIKIRWLKNIISKLILVVEEFNVVLYGRKTLQSCDFFSNFNFKIWASDQLKTYNKRKIKKLSLIEKLKNLNRDYQKLLKYKILFFKDYIFRKRQ